MVILRYRYIKLTKPPCSAQWETRFQAASAIGYKTRKDDMTMMLLRGMRGRWVLQSLFWDACVLSLQH